MNEPLSRERGNEAATAVAILLALVAAGALTAQLALFFAGRAGDGAILGATIGFLGAVIGSAASSSARSANAFVGIFLGTLALGVVLVVIGMAGVGFGIIAGGFIATALAVPMVHWAGGIEGKIDQGDGTGMKTVASNPVPAAIVAGILFFALPGSSPLAGPLAAAYFISLLTYASLASMLARARSFGGEVSVDPRALGRWVTVGLVLAFLCALVGFGGPLVFRPQDGVVSKVRESLVMGRPKQDSAAEGRLAGRLQPQKGQAQAAQPSPQPQPNQAQPKGGRPEPPPPPPPDPKEFGWKFLVLLVGAGALLAIATKYGSAIAGWIARAWTALLAPWRNAREKRRQAAEAARYERAIAQALQEIGDPFAPVEGPPELSSIPAAYTRFEVALAVNGTVREESESVQTFLGRVGRAHPFDKTKLALVGRTVSRSVYASRPPSEAELAATHEALRELAELLLKALPAERLALKKREVLRARAIRHLEEKESVPS